MGGFLAGERQQRENKGEMGPGAGEERERDQSINDTLIERQL
jgi:hypothetical protein